MREIAGWAHDIVGLGRGQRRPSIAPQSAQMSITLEDAVIFGHAAEWPTAIGPHETRQPIAHAGSGANTAAGGDYIFERFDQISRRLSRRWSETPRVRRMPPALKADRGARIQNVRIHAEF
jgi:hypothetical protein